jgi:methyl-accepting chemotaxis protein
MGRGFAVVAGEVRNLAQRSGNAAKEISTLIQESTDKIEHGTEQANLSGQSLTEIIESVKTVSRLISEMAAASDEQKQGINQINIAISELDSMTQQNAALVEETAASSEEMANQAQELESLMGMFTIRQ